MKKKFFKIFLGIILISLSLGAIYMVHLGSSKHDNSIDLTGGNGFWQASLNIIPKYNSELINGKSCVLI